MALNAQLLAMPTVDPSSSAPLGRSVGRFGPSVKGAFCRESRACKDPSSSGLAKFAALSQTSLPAKVLKLEGVALAGGSWEMA